MPDSTESQRPADEEQDDQPEAAEESETSEEAPEDDGEDLDSSELDDVSPLREMVEYVARALTSNPDAVSVTEEQDSNRTVLHLSVDEKDKGKVIGRDGRVAQSIRSLLRVAATKQGTRITLEID